MKLEIRFIVSMFFAIIVAIFAIQNAGSIDVNFFFWDITISQAIVIFGSAIIGGVIVFLLGLIKHIKQNRKMKKLTKEIETLTLELKELRRDELVVDTNEEVYLESDTKDEPNREQDPLDDLDL